MFGLFRTYRVVIVFATSALSVMLGGATLAVTESTQAASAGEITLFDFTNVKNLDDWVETSDTVRTVGMSKAVLTLQKTQVFQRAILFTLLNPQENGAAFAGVRTPTRLDLSNYKTIEISCRAQGANENYKIILRHNGMSVQDVGYEKFFSVPVSSSEFSTISVDLSEFKPYFRGAEKPDAGPLNTSNITSFGLQMYGGVYLSTKQKGVSSLEINRIVAKKA